MRQACGPVPEVLVLKQDWRGRQSRRLVPLFSSFHLDCSRSILKSQKSSSVKRWLLLFEPVSCWASRNSSLVVDLKRTMQLHRKESRKNSLLLKPCGCLPLGSLGYSLGASFYFLHSATTTT